MSLDISLRNVPRKLKMRGPEDTVEWTQDYQQKGQYSDYDDTGLFTDDYDDEVFATLNS